MPAGGCDLCEGIRILSLNFSLLDYTRLMKHRLKSDFLRKVYLRTLCRWRNLPGEFYSIMWSDQLNLRLYRV
ncbi:unnamed protein product [Calypogeia fissa]